MNKNYQKKRNEFLDEIQPDDLINGENFNQLGEIIDKIHESILINQKNSAPLIQKATSNLFRENSLVIEKFVKMIKT